MDIGWNRFKMSFMAFFILAGFSFVALPLKIFAQSENIDGSLKYLVSFQDHLTGGLAEELYDDPQALQTDWAIMAFSASGYDGSTVGKPSLVEYAQAGACSLTAITDIERRVIALQSAGVDTSKLDDCDLQQKIVSGADAGGKIGPDLVSTVFGVIALSSAGNNLPAGTVEYIILEQKPDGSWDSGWGGESNFTAQAIMALRASGHNVEPSVYDKARAYLKSLQTETGGVKYDGGIWSTESDTFSDSYTLQAIYSLGETPNDSYWLRNGKSIIDDLQSLRNSDGSYSFNNTFGRMNPVWTTSVALIGLNGKFLPIYAKSLSPWQKELPTPAPTATSEPLPTPTAQADYSSVPSVTATPALNITSSGDLRNIKETFAVGQSSYGENKNKAIVEQSNASTEALPNGGEVLGNSGSRKSNDLWAWLIMIGISSLITGASVKFLELKYANKK